MDTIINDPDIVYFPITQILIQVEATVGSYFFPSMGPYQPDLQELKAIQFKIINRYCKNLDAELFIEQNPIF